MGGKRRVSGDQVASKTQKALESKLPAIPADSSKLPHMKIFNEWRFFGYLSCFGFYRLSVCYNQPPRDAVVEQHGAFDKYLAKSLESKVLDMFVRPVKAGMVDPFSQEKCIAFYKFVDSKFPSVPGVSGS